MMLIDTILVAVKPDDENDRIVDAVVDVAVPTEASVVLWVNHTEENADAAMEDLGRVSADELAERNQAVQDAVSRLESANISHEVRGAIGESGKTLVGVGEELGADRLFIQERSRSPAGKALFGSMAQTVLLNADCPITFVRR